MSNNPFGLVLEGLHLLESASHQVEFMAAFTPDWVANAAPYALGAMGARLLWAVITPVSYLGEGIATGIAYFGAGLATAFQRVRNLQSEIEVRAWAWTKALVRKQVAFGVRAIRKALRRDK